MNHENKKRKICVTLINRANYGRLKSVMTAIKNHPDLELQVICGSAMLIYNYGNAIDVVERDGFKVDEKIFMHVAGETPMTMAKSVGMGMIEFPAAYDRLKPDIVMVNADRYETLAIAASASYMNIPVAHQLGGECTGTIDDYVRHAVTKLSDIHFAAHTKAAERVVMMGEDPSRVYVTGNPSLDVIHESQSNVTNQQFWEKYGGKGGGVNIDEPFLLSIFHPVTTDYGKNRTNAEALLSAVDELEIPTIMLWPNNDAGSDEIAKAMRVRFDQGNMENLHFIRNLAIEDYLTLMARSSAVIGNSSSGIMEAGFLGVPCVNIGNRQEGREQTHNVINVEPNKEKIIEAIKQSIEKKSYPKDPLFGDGKSGKRIADILATIPLMRPKIYFEASDETKKSYVDLVEREVKQRMTTE